MNQFYFLLYLLHRNGDMTYNNLIRYGVRLFRLKPKHIET